MGRLRRLSGIEVRSILAKYGFTEKRRRGSHVVMQQNKGGTTTTVIVPDHRELRIGTLRSIIRQSGLERAYFEET